MKLTSEELSDTVIESLVLATGLLERFEIMNENGLFVQRTKQLVKNTIPHIEEYVRKLIISKDPEEQDHFKKGATVISELLTRVETALKTKNILDISNRKKYLKEIIEDTVLFPDQKKELYEKIRDSGILNY
jgi:chaperonin GroEL (HSP60 family)